MTLFPEKHTSASSPPKRLFYIYLLLIRRFRQETIDVDLDRPENGGFGLLIARDKTLPPPALFVREVTPGGVAARTGLLDKGNDTVRYIYVCYTRMIVNISPQKFYAVTERHHN